MSFIYVRVWVCSFRDLGNGCSKLKWLIDRGKGRIGSFEPLMRLTHVNRNYELYLVGAVKFKVISIMWL